MNTKTQKKLQLSDVQKDINKRMKDFESHRAKLNILKNFTAAKPKSKGLIKSFFGL